MSARSLRPEIRNPLLALPEFAELRAALQDAPEPVRKKFAAAWLNPSCAGAQRQAQLPMEHTA